MGKQCRTCVFNTKKESCKILNERIEKDCWAWADEEEYEKREEAIEAYQATHSIDMAGGHEKTRKYKQKIIDEFMDLYEKGLSDVKIAQIIGVNPTTIWRYRNSLGLPYHSQNKKNHKKSLRQQANKK